MICNKSSNQIGYEVINGAMPRMFYVADILEFVVDSLDERPFSEQYLVVQIHKRVLHVLPDLRDKVYVVNKKSIEKVLAYVTPVRKQLSKRFLSEVLVFQQFAVVRVSRCERPLHNLSTVADDDVQFESEEPAHLALGRPSLHCPMAASPLNVTGDKRNGVDDGYT